MKLIALVLLVPIAVAAAHRPAPSAIDSDTVVTGRVTDAASGGALSRVQVSLDGHAEGALSDTDGVFEFTVPAGLSGTRVTISARHIGYEASSVTRRVRGDTIRVDFALKQAAMKLNPLVISEAASAVPQMDGRTRMTYIAGAPAHPGMTVRMVDPDWNTENYDVINENEFRSVTAEPLSTFSIDVDRASYSNVRRMIRSGSLPPKDAVRIEEMINYFPYTPVAPSAGEPFSVVTEMIRAPWQPRHHLARISLHAERVDLEDMPPNNLVFLLDVSGSMMPANKLPLLKKAMRMLVAEMRPQDRIAIVVYAGSAGLALESTSGAEKGRILEAIEGLEAGGSTAGGAGIRLAYDVARANHLANGNNRIILATDGDFNIGVSSDAEMVRLIEQKREQGTFLTVLGFGMGNLKDSRLEKIADHGNGNYAYIDDLAEARKVLVSEMGATLLTVAKDVKVQIEFNPKLVRAYRLIGYENRLLANEDFDDDGKDAGEIGAGHTVTVLYEIVPVGVEGTVAVREPGDLRYQRPAAAVGSAPSNELAFVKLRYKQPTGSTSRLMERAMRPELSRGSEDIRFAAAVAAFGMLLRDSDHRGSTSFDLVTSLATDAVGADTDGHRRGFLQLVSDARRLSTVAVGDDGR
ncbi:MAG: von Willebrand factor type A domain-containing protein [Gemmatimonadetes bacterium]|nr:von Willebrand factor type A domain-containing protein [Gemmatimonadota bacterium]